VQRRARAGLHFAYWGRSSLVTNLECMVTGRGLEGYYAENTRMLSRLALCANGRVPRAIAVRPAGANRVLAYYELDAAEGVPEGSVYITLDQLVTDLLRIRLRVDNFDLAGRACNLKPRDDEHPHPGIDPASCAPQAWSASTVVILMQSLLGMLPIAPLRLMVVDPHLRHGYPTFVWRASRWATPGSTWQCGAGKTDQLDTRGAPTARFASCGSPRPRPAPASGLAPGR
jgi:glycogen debranching enzyme